ncbi:hypothetical protein C8J56DRAFT_1039412 [Mycena floridula]|nr:hypothetical protein C8J56DRAFT_1039412 [Mycena floridula]
MSRTKAKAVAQWRALGIVPSSSRAHSHSSASPDPQTVRPRKSTTTKKTGAAKKSTGARAASPGEPEQKRSKYGRYYENNRLKRKQDANSWYERVGRARRQEAAAAKKAEKNAAKAAGLNAEQPAAVEESLAYITIRKVKHDTMVWAEDGGFQVQGEWEENDEVTQSMKERRVELKREGEGIWFRAISLFRNYGPPQNVDEAIQIHNISVEVMSMLRLGLQALEERGMNK